MTKFGKFAREIWYAVAVYIATFLGIVLSQYAPLLLTKGKLDNVFDFVRLGISALVAFYVVATQEQGGDEEGKRKNINKRIANAFAHGIAWNSIMGIAGTAAQVGQ
jgi:hypothetical protein